MRYRCQAGCLLAFIHCVWSLFCSRLLDQTASTFTPSCTASSLLLFPLKCASFSRLEAASGPGQGPMQNSGGGTLTKGL